MSFAVVEGNTCHHVGEDAAVAAQIFESKPKSKLVRVSSLKELEAILQAESVQACAVEEEVEPGFSDVLQQVLDKLDESGINANNAEELRKKLQSGGEQLVADVRSLGIRGMRMVGDGLTTLGEFMKSAATEDVQAQSKKSCCGGGDSCEHSNFSGHAGSDDEANLK